MKNNLVSIITPSYNSEKFISQTIESVLAQTYQDWEMLIVDDCSSDNSKKIIKEYTKKDNRIKLLQLEKNSGPAIARNKGIKEAKGRYIAFLDSDDLWLPQKLEKQIKFLYENSLPLTYSAYITIDEQGNELYLRKAKKHILWHDMLKSNHIGNLTGIYDSTVLGKEYLEDMGHEDYTLWLKLIKKVGHTKGIEEPLAKYRILSSSISANKLKAMQWQWNIYRRFLNMSIIYSFYNIFWYIYYAFNKRKG